MSINSITKYINGGYHAKARAVVEAADDPKVKDTSRVEKGKLKGELQKIEKALANLESEGGTDSAQSFSELLESTERLFDMSEMDPDKIAGLQEELDAIRERLEDLRDEFGKSRVGNAPKYKIASNKVYEKTFDTYADLVAFKKDMKGEIEVEKEEKILDKTDTKEFDTEAEVNKYLAANKDIKKVRVETKTEGEGDKAETTYVLTYEEYDYQLKYRKIEKKSAAEIIQGVIDKYEEMGAGSGGSIFAKGEPWWDSNFSLKAYTNIYAGQWGYMKDSRASGDFEGVAIGGISAGETNNWGGLGFGLTGLIPFYTYHRGKVDFRSSVLVDFGYDHLQMGNVGKEWRDESDFEGHQLRMLAGLRLEFTPHNWPVRLYGEGAIGARYVSLNGGSDASVNTGYITAPFNAENLSGWNLSGMLGAGLTFQITGDFSIDVGYRHYFDCEWSSKKMANDQSIKISDYNQPDAIYVGFSWDM